MKENINKYSKHEKIMKRSGFVFGVLMLLVLVNLSFVLAADCTSFNYSNWTTCSNGTQTRTVTNSSPIGCTGGNPILNQSCSSQTPAPSVNQSNVEKGFTCLSTKVKSDCSGTSKIQEIALTILASPDNVTKACTDRLISLAQSGSCFGDSGCNVRDTALAILALNHVGKTTATYQSWLKNQTKTATDLIWYLEQDSDTAALCQVSYSSQNYQFNVGENKKIDSSAGNCLSLAQSNYWLQVSPSCYGTEFTLACDRDFKATFLYKQPDAQTIYVLSDTKIASATQQVTLKVKSSCFGTNGCDYEGSAWATLALKKTGNDIAEYIPYLIASEDANQNYLPDAFLHMIVDYSEYGTKLIQQQKLNYWEAENTAYNKDYDTALALLALSDSNQQQVTQARNWLMNLEQGADGCWNNGNIRDTAIVLWAYAKRAAPAGIITTTTIADCQGSGFFCLPSSQCALDQRLGNYACASLSQTCCQATQTQTCAEKLGTTCGTGQQCNGVVQSASDTSSCCLGQCEPIQDTNECESSSFFCKPSCSSGQTSVSQSCGDSSMICCKNNPVSAPSRNLTWLWILLAIFILILILAIVFRDRIKVLIFKARSGFKKEGSSSGSNLPPRSPPFTPMSRGAPMQPRPMPRPNQPMPGRPMPQQRPLPPRNVQPAKPAEDDVFKKLRDLGK